MMTANAKTATIRERGAQRRTLTFSCDYLRLQQARHGGLMVMLMMAANDLLLANWGMVRYRDGELPRQQLHVRPGAVSYFVRLQCSHLYEAMPLIGEICSTPDLAARVDRCLPETKAAYHSLLECLRGGRRRSDFNRWIARLRNKIAFHYDKSHVDLSLDHLAERALKRNPVDVPSALITMGLDIGLPRYRVADTVAGEILMRQILGVDSDADPSVEASKLRDFVNEMCGSFLRFVNEYAVNYLREYARAA